MEKYPDGFKFGNLSTLFTEVDTLKILQPYMKKGTSSTLEEKIERERAKLFSSGSLEKIPELVQEMEDISGISQSLILQMFFQHSFEKNKY